MSGFLIIDIPCCPHCHDWLEPVMLIEYPAPASVWACPNQHGSAVRDWGVPLDEEQQWVFAKLAALLDTR